MKPKASTSVCFRLRREAKVSCLRLGARILGGGVSGLEGLDHQAVEVSEFRVGEFSVGVGLRFWVNPQLKM